MKVPTNTEAVIALHQRVEQLQDNGNYKSLAGQGVIKRLLVGVWALLEPQSKRAFLDSLDDDMRFNKQVRATKIDAKLQEEARIWEMLMKWPEVLPSVGASDLGFAKSILKNRSKPLWWPSEAQAARMKALWAERGADVEEDIEVTEVDE